MQKMLQVDTSQDSYCAAFEVKRNMVNTKFSRLYARRCSYNLTISNGINIRHDFAIKAFKRIQEIWVVLYL